VTDDMRDLLADLLPEPPAGPAEERALTEALVSLADSVPALRPSDGLKARLLASAGAPTRRWAPFADRVAQLFDVARDQASSFLAMIGDPGAWEAAIADGCALIHLQGGPRVATADVGFARVAPGTRFPEHRHEGDEVTLVLQGRYRDSDGSIVGPGDRVDLPAGSSHFFDVLPGEELIFAVVVEGVSFGDDVQAP